MATARTTIVVDPHSREPVVDQAVAALANAGLDVFQRGGLLVRVLHARDVVAPDVARDDGARIISPMPAPRVVEILGRVASWETLRTDPNGEGVTRRRGAPPQWVAAHVLARGEWPGVASLRAITATPVLLADGTVSRAGYDPRTGIWCDPSGSQIEIPESPTLADAQRALATLEAVVADFPFETPADRAVWLCAVLSPLAVYAYEGPTPCIVFEASTRGSGKTLAATAAAMIATGHAPAQVTPTNGEEERKRVTALALAGDPVILLDNVSGELGSDALAGLLTSPTRTWSDRRLGVSETVRTRVDAVWLVTANNARLSPDMLRRCVVCRIDSVCERPETRTGFREPDLLGSIRANRPALAAAAITILRAYVVAGRPRVELRPLGSYEGWSRVVRAALVFAGAADPEATRGRTLDSSDDEGEALAVLFETIAAYPAPVAAGILFDAAKVSGRLREAFDVLLGGRVGSAKLVGNLLAKFRSRVVTGRRLVDAGKDPSTRTRLWRVVDSPKRPEASEVSPSPTSISLQNPP